MLAAFDDAIEEDGFKIEGYEILCEIDRGGMGVVYHARQLRPERDVALKVILPKLGVEKAMRKRFQTEARAMAALDHPGILPIYEVGESNGLPFFSMKLATGGSLSERLKGEPIAGKVAATWLSEICSAINHAHQRGVLHRDLKPANFLFDEEDRLYVADFGVAKLLDLENLDLTKTDGFVGTPHYMPPEVARGNSNEITVLGDLYSLGAVFYECLTGERPHKQHSHIGSLLEPSPMSRSPDLATSNPMSPSIWISFVKKP